MPPKRKAEATPAASPATPSPAGNAKRTARAKPPSLYLDIRRVDNGFTIHIDGGADRDSTLIAATPDDVLLGVEHWLKTTA